MTLTEIRTGGTARHQGEQHQRKPHRFQGDVFTSRPLSVKISPRRSSARGQSDETRETTVPEIANARAAAASSSTVLNWRAIDVGGSMMMDATKNVITAYIRIPIPAEYYQSRRT